MRVRAWFVAVALCASCTQAFAASFSCDKAATYSEIAVCSDPGLSRQDDELAKLYKQALVNLPDPKAVQWVQQNWLEARDRCNTDQCVKDAYSNRIVGLQRQLGISTEHHLTSSPAAVSSGTATTRSASPSDDECANLNAAVNAALNSKSPAASITQFGGRVVTGWRQSDYDAFLTALTACESRADVAPVLNSFPDESRLLLTTLRERSVRESWTTAPARAPELTQPNPEPAPSRTTEPKTSPTDAVRSAPGAAQSNSSPQSGTVPASKMTPTPAPSTGPATSQQLPSSSTAATQNSDTDAPVGNFLAILLVVWIVVVIGGVVAGFKGAIVVYRNFDDLAIVFFMGVVLVVGGLAGFYFMGFKNSIATPLLWGLSGLGTMGLFGWTVARTWRDQQPESVWRFVLAMITKMSLGILFVNNLVTLISPSGKTWGARSQARNAALLFLAVLTPVVLRLVRNHEGVWAPHNLLSAYRRRRMGV